MYEFKKMIRRTVPPTPTPHPTATSADSNGGRSCLSLQAATGISNKSVSQSTWRTVRQPEGTGRRVPLALPCVVSGLAQLWVTTLPLGESHRVSRSPVTLWD